MVQREGKYLHRPDGALRELSALLADVASTAGCLEFSSPGLCSPGLTRFLSDFSKGMVKSCFGAASEAVSCVDPSPADGVTFGAVSFFCCPFLPHLKIQAQIFLMKFLKDQPVCLYLKALGV